MTRPERISRMKGSRNANSGVRINNSRVKRQGYRITGKQALIVLVLLCLLMGGGISHVWSNFEATQKGYGISQLKNEELRLMDINRKLRLELSLLKSAKNLENLAKGLGLSQPSPEQIVILP